MLVNHPDSQLVSVVRASNLADARADDHITRNRQVISHDAFDQRTFSGAVLAQQSVKSARIELQGDIFVRDKGTEPFGDIDQLEPRRLPIGKISCHAIAAINDSE